MTAIFDVAIGMDHTTLDLGLAQLYAAPDARTKLFEGSTSGTIGDLAYTASYDVLAAPTFDLAPSAALQALWPQSIDGTGKNPTGPLPSPNLFVLTLPKFTAQFTLGTAKPVAGTADNVHVFSTLTVAAGVVTLSPVSIWIDETHMKVWNKVILNGILALVLAKAKMALAGITIPPLTFTEAGVTVSLLPPIASIVQGQLIVASSLTATGKTDIAGASWPAKPLFALVSGGALTSILQSAVNANLVNKEFSGSGSITGAQWDASGKATSIAVTSNSTDRTLISAKIAFGFSAELKPLGIGGPCAIGAATSGL